MLSFSQNGANFQVCGLSVVYGGGASMVNQRDGVLGLSITMDMFPANSTGQRYYCLIKLIHTHRQSHLVNFKDVFLTDAEKDRDYGFRQLARNSARIECHSTVRTLLFLQVSISRSLPWPTPLLWTHNHDYSCVFQNHYLSYLNNST